MKKFFKRTVILILVLLVFYFTTSLSCSFSNILLGRSINHQVEYISHALLQGADELAQKNFPEGYLFSNCIFLLSLIEFTEIDTSRREDFAKLVDQSLKKVLSDRGKSNFDDNLTLQYGAFYHGWTNYSLKKYIESNMFQFSSHKNYFKSEYFKRTKLLIEFQADSIALAETYKNAIWPADNLLCIVSLPDSLNKLKVSWLTKIKESSSNSLNLIHHDNFDTSVVRGSSQALILYFLKDILGDQSKVENQIFKDHFQKSILGVNFMREYQGLGKEDVDSGPIIFGFGSVATIMNVKTQAKYGEKERLTWNFLNCIGIPMNVFGQKYYLFKKQIMFDIFMLWTAVSLKN